MRAGLVLRKAWSTLGGGSDYSVGGVAMYEQAEDAETHEAQVVAKERAQWQRPQWRKLEAGEAELGPSHGAPDGPFTTS
jgi:hypothetical protein